MLSLGVKGKIYIILLCLWPVLCPTDKFIIHMMLTYFYFLITEVVCGPPAIYLEYVRKQVKPEIGVAGQNCYKVGAGAFTGDNR